MKIGRGRVGPGRTTVFCCRAGPIFGRPFPTKASAMARNGLSGSNRQGLPGPGWGPTPAC